MSPHSISAPRGPRSQHLAAPVATAALLQTHRATRCHLAGRRAGTLRVCRRSARVNHGIRGLLHAGTLPRGPHSAVEPEQSSCTSQRQSTDFFRCDRPPGTCSLCAVLGGVPLARRCQQSAHASTAARLPVLLRRASRARLKAMCIKHCAGRSSSGAGYSRSPCGTGCLRLTSCITAGLSQRRCASTSRGWAATASSFRD